MSESASNSIFADDELFEALPSGFASKALLKLIAVSASSGKDWEDDYHKEMKDALREELIEMQKGQCAYCRREIERDSGRVEIDHILPKANKGSDKNWSKNEIVFRRSTKGYEKFMFELVNLALTCKRCNNNKGTYDCLKDRAAICSSYPTAEEVIWVHPHYKKYSEHISIFKDLIYMPTSGSVHGSAVIYACKLDKISAVEMRSRDRIIRQSKDITKAIIKMGSRAYFWDEKEMARLLSIQFNAHEDDVLDIILSYKKLTGDKLIGRAVRPREVD